MSFASMNPCYLIVFLTCALLGSCKSDKAELETTSIDGEWEIVSATRDRKLTKTVDGAIFLFDLNTQSMTTDLLGSKASSPFHLSDNVIKQEIPEISYEIVSLSDTSMQLAMTMRNTDFGFLLKRPETE